VIIDVLKLFILNQDLLLPVAFGAFSGLLCAYTHHMGFSRRIILVIGTFLIVVLYGLVQCPIGSIYLSDRVAAIRN
jgi:hypothetical protein